MLKPAILRTGDKIAAISLSWGGPHTYPHRYEAGKRQLSEAFAVEVVETRHALKPAEWLSKNPRARADDLMEAFSDPTVRGIFSTIGGDDSIRLLRHLDLSVIRQNPKVFLGYSDTTVTHFACLKAGVVSFYGPSIMAGFGENDGLFPYMVESVGRTLFSGDVIGKMRPNPDGWTAEYLDWKDPENQRRKRRLNVSDKWRFLQGTERAEGPLIGGCLEVLEWLRGTRVWPDERQWDGAILFLETSEEGPPPDVVSRALRVYAAQGILQRLSGLLFGRPGGRVPPADFQKYDRAIQEVVAGEEGLEELPVITRMDFGHTDPMMVLPYGVRACIDPAKQEFSILENAVQNC